MSWGQITRPTARAQELRNNATDAEVRLWKYLSRRQLGGYKFSRQMPVAGFICDFLCREARLIVEVDGGQHDERAQADARRTQALESEGYQVIRFWNNEVLGNTEGVLANILQALRSGPPPTIAAASWLVRGTSQRLQSRKREGS